MAARPDRLLHYGTEAVHLGAVLNPAEHGIDLTFAPYAAGCSPPGFGVRISLSVLIRSVAEDAARLDRWVGDVGRWFDAADQGTLATLPRSVVAGVTAPFTVRRAGWPAPVVQWWNPLDQPRKGRFADAGYGAACSGGHTASTSILGPDGLGYPVIVPGRSGAPDQSYDWVPTATADPVMGTISDTSRTWHTVFFTETIVAPDNSVGYRAAGAVAATAGWSPVSGPSVSPGELGRILRLEPNGEPHIVAGPVRNHPGVGAALPAPAGDAADGAVRRRREGKLAANPTVTAGADALELAMLVESGWRAAANEGTGFVQAQYQRDDAGNRRVLVRGYEVRVANGRPQVSGAYWNGVGWTPIGTSTLPGARYSAA